MFGGLKTRMLQVYLKDNPTGSNFQLYNPDDPTNFENATKELAKIEGMMMCMPLKTFMLNNAVEKDKEGKTTWMPGRSTRTGNQYMMEDAVGVSGGRYIRHRLGIP